MFDSWKGIAEILPNPLLCDFSLQYRRPQISRRSTKPPFRCICSRTNVCPGGLLATNARTEVLEWLGNLHTHTVHKLSPAIAYDQRFIDNYTHEKMWRHLISSSKYVKPAANRMNAPCEREQTQNCELT